MRYSDVAVAVRARPNAADLAPNEKKMSPPAFLYQHQWASSIRTLRAMVLAAELGLAYD
jgi:hypothetical protein